MNSIRVIHPYYAGTWVFDDQSVGLCREPFVCGIPEIIDILVKGIPDARSGFRLLFSDQKFPGTRLHLDWVRAENGGNWYTSDFGDGWLCPALLKYFDRAPLVICVAAEPLKDESWKDIRPFLPSRKLTLPYGSGI